MASPIAMLLLWGDTRTQLYNDGYRALMGSRHPDAFGAGVTESWGDEWNLDGAMYDRARAGESTLAEGILVSTRADPSSGESWFTIGYGPVRDESGAIVAVLVTALETTKLVSAQRHAEAATRAKGDFLAVMSHELRTPLNAIGGYAELLELGVRGPVTPQQRADLERIQLSQRHLLDVIGGVLNYAKVEAGILHFAVEDVPVDELLARCHALVAPDAKEKQLEVRYADCVTHLTARADAEKVEQIVINLLGNAIKFTAPGGTVVLDCAEEEGKRIVIRVSDTGQGIASDDLECIFQPFVQVDAKMSRAQEGTGLGLAISRKLARGMGGELSASSTRGSGSTFTLILACGRGEAQDDEKQRRLGDAGGAGVPPTAPAI